MMRLLDLAGRNAVVTGSSAGIGAAVCNALRDQGCNVIGLDLLQPSTSTTTSLNQNTTFTHVTCDLRDPVSITNAMAQAVASLSASISSSSSTPALPLNPFSSSSSSTLTPSSSSSSSSSSSTTPTPTIPTTTPPSIDYVVNVAGRDPKYSLSDGGVEQWDDILNLNLRGQYLLIRECVPLLEKGSGKSIVNISSINYQLGVPRRTIYTVSKTGILGLTRGLSRELGSKNIRINTISPGWVFTEIQKKEFFDKPEGEKYYKYLQEVQSLPAKHILPEDIANHVLFLLSSAASACTGSNHVVDAGWLLQ